MVMVEVSSFQKCCAQYYFYDNDTYDTPLTYELGGSVGAMNCLTDLGGKRGIGKRFLKDLNIGNQQTCAGAFISAMYQSAYALRIQATFGGVNAYDSILKPVRQTTGGRYERNLSFKSKITEVIMVAEFHPLFIFIDWPSKDVPPPRFSPYALAGIGFFSFNPQTKLGNKWVDLQPLSTEGQGFDEYPDRKPYKLHQVNFPVGFGVKYEVSGLINVRAELCHRILSTDYLDDVSKRYVNPDVYDNHFNGTRLINAKTLNARNSNTTPPFIAAPGKIRGDPRDNDAYFTAEIKVSIVFGRERIKRFGY